MPKLWLSLTILLPLFASANAPTANTPAADARSIAHDMETRYQHAHTLKATFFESYSQGGGKHVAESGTVYFSHPGRMRWEYEAPETKLFLVDGANAWFYVTADHTASRAKVKESSDWRTPIALLAGKANLTQMCKQITLIDAASAKDPAEKPLAPSDSVLRCDPRDDSGGDLHGVLLEVDEEKFLVRVVIRESGGVETEFRFGNWEENVAVEESKFHFQPPPGVSIVDENSLENGLH